MRVLNVRIDGCDMAACVAKIEMWLAAFHGQAGGGMKQVITLNAEGVFIAKNDADFAALIESSDLVTPDGSGVVWAAKKYGYAGLARVAGIDLLEKLCAVGQDRDWSVYLLGGQPDIAALAGQNLLQRYPRLRIVGSENGYFREREQQVIEAINQAQPDLLFAGLGMPFQEKWLAARKQELQVGVAIGVGGSFDVLSGSLKRAPLWMQNLRLEWLYRLLQQPSRWRRFLVLPRFMAAVCRDSKRAI